MAGETDALIHEIKLYAAVSHMDKRKTGMNVPSEITIINPRVLEMRKTELDVLSAIELRSGIRMKPKFRSDEWALGEPAGVQ